jgi:hypothetical protein
LLSVQYDDKVASILSNVESNVELIRKINLLRQNKIIKVILPLHFLLENPWYGIDNYYPKVLFSVKIINFYPLLTNKTLIILTF